MKKFTVFLLFSLCLNAASSVAEVRDTHIFMAGDSTMSVKDPKDYPETGWGVPFSSFFNETITVENLAKNGRSTRTFISEGRWGKIISALEKEDYVFIQFAHNDEVERKKDRYTTPKQYKENLTRMIEEVRSLEAHPILLTPIIRRHFNEKGRLKATHPYAKLAREVSKETGVFFIDMEHVTHDYFEAMGDEASALRFMHLRANEHPNYPNGLRDDTHFNALGAREVAQLVLKELKKAEHPLSLRLREVDPKHLKYSY